jgi:uncharacterized membrane protein YozB (DUF420 family)
MAMAESRHLSGEIDPALARKRGYGVPRERTANVNTGFLGTRASWAADINLIVQIVLLVVLVAGRVQAKRRNLTVHHTWMTVVVAVNAVMIIAIMNPAFFRLLPLAWPRLGAPGPTLLWLHVVVAVLAELMGLYAVLWMGTDLPELLRMRNLKWFMRINFLLWTLALVGGIVLYWARYM